MPKVNVSFNLPHPVYNMISRVKHIFKPVLPLPQRNLVAERDIEWSWVSANIPNGKGRALDFGPGGSYLSLTLAHKGYDVTAVDLMPIRWYHRLPNVNLIQGDLLQLPLEDDSFDVILVCSTVEHVGIVGRYNITQHEADGDLDAMRKLHNLLKTNGTMLLTCPVGHDAVFPPLHRVYGSKRLPQLLEGYQVEHEEFWIKNEENCWIPCDKETAFAFEPYSYAPNGAYSCYALGAFILRKRSHTS